ncbi:hypothetical protein SLE2022_402700 [Rubroshorea leprosula]
MSFDQIFSRKAKSGKPFQIQNPAIQFSDLKQNPRRAETNKNICIAISSSSFRFAPYLSAEQIAIWFVIFSGGVTN